MKKLTKEQLTNLANIKPNKIVIEFGYDNKVVLPLKHGLAIIEAMEYGESFIEKYNEQIKIQPITNDFKTHLLGDAEYIDIKTCMLLGVTMDELKGKE